MLRAGVIGVGMMGKNHARVYSQLESVKLVAVCDVNNSALNKISHQFNCTSYTNYLDMFNTENLDLISIVVPTIDHYKVAKEAIKARINVLIEKPIANTIEEGEELIALAKEMNVKLMVGHIERFNPVINELKRRLGNNELGKIFKIDVLRIGPSPIRIRDVGVIVDLAIHDIDILNFLTESEVIRVYGETEKKINSKFEDIFQGMLKFADGTIGMLNINWLTPTKIRKIYVTGVKGMFIANYLSGDLYFYDNPIASDFEFNSAFHEVSEGNMTKIKINLKEPLVVEIESFISCVQNKTEPLVNGTEALKALKIAFKFIESSSIHQVINLI